MHFTPVLLLVSIIPRVILSVAVCSALRCRPLPLRTSSTSHSTEIVSRCSTAQPVRLTVARDCSAGMCRVAWWYYEIHGATLVVQCGETAHTSACRSSSPPPPPPVHRHTPSSPPIHANNVLDTLSIFVVVPRFCAGSPAIPSSLVLSRRQRCVYVNATQSSSVCVDCVPGGVAEFAMINM